MRINRQSGDAGIGVIIFLVIVIIVGIFINVIALRSSATELDITVDKTWVEGEGGKYIVVDTNGNAYEIEDSITFGTWNATDRYSMISVGKSYHVTKAGWRIRFFSMYPNLIKINEAK